MASQSIGRALALTALLLSCVSSFYLPGVAPQDYEKGADIEIKVNKLDSTKTQLPYNYYKTLPFCEPEEITRTAENLGEVLSGDEIENSAYEVKMDKSEFCKVLCVAKYSETDAQKFIDKIEEEYLVNWIVDGMPAVTKYHIRKIDEDEEIDEEEEESSDDAEEDQGYLETHYEKGFRLGYKVTPELLEESVGAGSPPGEQGATYLNNHVSITIAYHRDEANYEGYRVVGFEVEPSSVQHAWTGGEKCPDRKPCAEAITIKTCDKDSTPPDNIKASVPHLRISGLGKDPLPVLWTYDVKFEESDIKWASRWDVYLKMTDPEIHWFSIINSIMIVLFLSGMVAMIMLRTLHKDLRRYNEMDLSEEAQQEETGWKLIHGEVFRPPRYPGFFSVLIGTGVQIFSMTLLTLTFALLGLLSPANRGGLMTALLLLFVSMGMFAGYASTRVYKMFKLVDWKRNTLITSLFFPGIMFTVFFILNLFVWAAGSSGAVPFSTLVALLVLWLGISVPLVYLGSYFAFKKPAIEPPVKVNNIPRMLLPDPAWYNSPYLSVLLGGVLPFGAVFIEIFFIMSSVWLHQFYYVFGFLFIVFIILIITCAEISIVMIYFQLCSENYHWWWRSFLTSGASALYVFAYSVLYFTTKLEIDRAVSGLLFFGYMLLVSFTFFVLTGTIGAVASFYFVRKIYASVKID